MFSIIWKIWKTKMKAGYYMQDDYGNVTLVNVSGIYDEQPLFIDKFIFFMASTLASPLP